MSYPLATTTWDERELEAIQAVVASRQYTMGERVRAFEQAFAATVGSAHAVMANSGSSANLLAVAALCYRSRHPLRAGEEVIVPAVSWATTYFPLTQYGLKLRLVDIDQDTLNLDLAQVEAAITPNTRLVMAVNLLGNPLAYDRLQALLAGRGIDLLEDNCEALGARYQGRNAGTFGLAGTFSSFFSHHISTMEGGMVVTNDAEISQIMLALRAHGWTRQLPKHNLVCGDLDDDPFQESFRFVLPGYNLRPLEFSGALGLCQLEKLAALVEGRRRNASIFQQVFANHPRVRIQVETGQSSWFGFALIVRPDAGLTRLGLRRALGREEIECRPVVAGNVARHPVIQHLPNSIAGALTQADWVHDHGLFVGNHHYDIEREILRLRRVIDDAPVERGR